MKKAVEFWERCPVCRARIKESPVCHRCGLDFSPMLGAADEAGELARRALYKLRIGKRHEAFWHALRAAQEHSTPETRKALALAALARRQFDLALALWRSIKTGAE